MVIYHGRCIVTHKRLKYHCSSLLKLMQPSFTISRYSIADEIESIELNQNGYLRCEKIVIKDSAFVYSFKISTFLSIMTVNSIGNAKRVQKFFIFRTIFLRPLLFQKFISFYRTVLLVGTFF